MDTEARTLRPIRLRVNGKAMDALVEPRTHLGDVLREKLRLTGTHLGCEHGVCGACTVLMDGAPVRSCITFAVGCENAAITTIEGFGGDRPMAALRDSFTRKHGLQCGFCTPGMLIAARDVIARHPDADERKIRHEMSGNLCRCTGYAGIIAAVADAQASLRAEGAATTPVPPAACARPGMLAFEPVDCGADGAAVAAEPAKAETPAARPGWGRFEGAFQIDRPIGEVWASFGDIVLVASCLDGVEVQEHSPTHVKGTMTVAVGPISATFAGAAQLVRDEAAMTGQILGAGSDKRSSTRTRGEVTYALKPVSDQVTAVSLVADYNIQGALAQFSRSSVIQDVGQVLLARFAQTLNARLAGEEPPATAQGRSLGLFFLGRIVLQQVVARLRRFGRR